jgi:Tol biopolymer transport system component
VYVYNLGDNTTTRLVDASGSAVAPRWSPDGTRIVFGDVRSSSTSIVVAAANGSGARQLQVRGAVDYSTPIWSTDGRYLIYISRYEDRADEIIYVAATTGEQESIIFPEIPNIRSVIVR